MPIDNLKNSREPYLPPLMPPERLPHEMYQQRLDPRLLSLLRNQNPPVPQLMGQGMDLSLDYSLPQFLGR